MGIEKYVLVRQRERMNNYLHGDYSAIYFKPVLVSLIPFLTFSTPLAPTPINRTDFTDFWLLPFSHAQQFLS